jgi:ribonuclease P protein component
MNTRFPRKARVRARGEFDRIFKQGRRTASPQFALHFLADETLPRLGLAVSRKVDPHAVGRNRIKRVLRETFRGLSPHLNPGAYVVVARNIAAQSGNEALRDGFVALLQRAGALPPSGSTGTIPSAPSANPLYSPAPDPSGGSSLPA